MAMWGKFFGGAVGFAMGGGVGAVVGAALGHAADNGTLLESPPGGWRDGWPSRKSPDPTGAAALMAAKVAAALGKREQLYALSLVMLSAKLARIDGPVNRAEIDAFKARFQIPRENVAEIGRLFDQARNRTDDFAMFATELGRAYTDDRQPLEDLLVVLFGIARADSPDGTINARERGFLDRVHAAFGLSPGAWDRAEHGGARPTVDETDAYLELGLTRDASDESVRLAWRQLVREHHPDILMARGASDRERDHATARIARINAAWDRIKKDRRL